MHALTTDEYKGDGDRVTRTVKFFQQEENMPRHIVIEICPELNLVMKILLFYRLHIMMIQRCDWNK